MPRKRKVVIRAIKNIEPGEEINYDYGTDYFKAYLKPIGCLCEACEKKRKKKRAEARVERLLLKAKAEKKALKKAKQAAAMTNEPLQTNPEAKLNGHSNGAKLNGRHLNGHLNGDGGQINTRKTMSVRPRIFSRGRGIAKDKQESKQARDSRASA
jgi:uncharacterized protein